MFFDVFDVLGRSMGVFEFWAMLFVLNLGLVTEWVFPFPECIS